MSSALGGRRTRWVQQNKPHTLNQCVIWVLAEIKEIFWIWLAAGKCQNTEQLFYFGGGGSVNLFLQQLITLLFLFRVWTGSSFLKNKEETQIYNRFSFSYDAQDLFYIFTCMFIIECMDM